MRVGYKETNSASDVFSDLSEYLDDGIKADVDRLLDLKVNSPEGATGKRLDNVNRYIEENFVRIEGLIKELPCEKQKSWAELNEIFLSLLK